jgi:hypothetical protein
MSARDEVLGWHPTDITTSISSTSMGNELPAMTTMMEGASKDTINPEHYKWHPVAECADISEHFPKNIGSAIEYLWRVGRKANAVEDLKKAIWFIKREIRRIERTRHVDP